jgi:hypothetical protein
MGKAYWALFDSLNVCGLGIVGAMHGFTLAGPILVGVGAGLFIGRVLGTLWPLDEQEAR